MTIKLRPYQQGMVDKTHAAHARGVRRPAVVAATGAGKTIVIAETVRTSVHAALGGKRAIVLAHREELVEQNAAKLRDVAPELRTGVVMAGRNEVDGHVISASVQTLASELRRRQIRDVGLVVVDECFPAGTLVGGVPIETLAVGDMVPSWDEESGAVQLRPVVAVMSRSPERMVRVELEDGRVINCTPNHPILTTGGWCNAGGLWRGAHVVSFTHDATARNDVHGVRKLGDVDNEGEDRQPSPFRPGVLLRRVPRYMGEQGQLAANGQDESPICLGSDAPEQPDASRGATGEDGGHAGGDRASTESARGQRQAGGGATTVAGRISRLADRGHGEDGRWGSSILVQRGHCSSVNEGGDRGRRGVPLLAGAPRLRPAQGESVGFARVVAVQVLERGRDATYGGVCPDGLVYNIEVDATHTYLIDGGLVVHNCHHAAADSYLGVLTHFGCMDGMRFGRGAARALGVTATMSRGDNKALGDVWEEIVDVVDTSQLIADGYLVRPVGIRVRVEDLDLRGVRKVGGDFSAAGLGRAFDASMAPKKIIEAMREHAADRQTILFAPLVATAEALRDELRGAGFTAEAVSAKTPRDERRAILQRYRDGAVQVLCNAMVFTEGTDLPMTSCIVVARPTMNAALFIQMVGRGLRLWPGKADCIVLDVVGATGRHRLAAPVELWGDEGLELDAPPVEADERTEEEIAADEDLDEQQQLDHLFGLDEPVHRDGNLVHEIVDLFEGSDAGWLRTYAGVWFLAAPERYVAVLPRAEHAGGGYAVVSLDRLRTGVSSWVMERVGELSYAMAHATGDVSDAERETMQARDRKAVGQRVFTQYGWRTHSPKAEAQRLGLIVPEGATVGEIRKMITVAYASARIDGALPAWVRR